MLSDAFAQQTEALEGTRIEAGDLADVNGTLGDLERFWSQCLTGPGRLFSAA